MKKLIIIFVLLTAFTLSAAISEAVTPIPEIKANGAVGTVSVAPGDNVSITVTLAPGDALGLDADWWVVAETGFGWYRYNVGTASWQPGQAVTYQGPLFELATREVLNMSTLPEGFYTFYFGTDMIMNGSFDAGETFLSDVNVSIAPIIPESLIINEIDYDQPGSDMFEYVEIANDSPVTVDLADYRLEFVNGFDNQIYASYDLTGFLLLPGNYFVVGNRAVTDIDMLIADNTIQNGSPDGIRIIRISTGEFVDGVAYEGEMPGTGEGFPPIAFDSGGADEESLSRCPDSSDLDNNEEDFALGSSTPGTANICF